MPTSAFTPGSLRRALRRSLLAGALVAGAVAAGGCRQDMHDQAKVEPLEPSTFFADGASARLPVAGTVARGQLREDVAFYTGFGTDNELVTELPTTLDRALLLRGKERYGIFCAPCHGQTGAGDGMVVRRGYKQPQSFHIARLRGEAIGYYFDVITRGFGQMPSYASQVKVEDRWAIAAFIRALQLSQGATAAALGPADLEALAASAGAGQAGEADATGAAAPGHGNGGHGASDHGVGEETGDD